MAPPDVFDPSPRMAVELDSHQPESHNHDHSQGRRRHRGRGRVVRRTVRGPCGGSLGEVVKNCAALNKVYPHGVGKKGAKDHTSGKRVTNYKVSNDVYAHNDGGSKRYSGEHDLDRDNDGIACEKR